MARNYWMVVATLENFEISKGLGFTLHGVGGRYRRRAQRMQPNDRVLYYVETIRKWAATATIRSNFFEDRTPIWKSAGRREDHFGYRVKLAPDVVLVEEDYIDAMVLAPSLEYLKKWAPEIWPLAFHDRLHLLPQKDFRLIEAEMNRNVSRRRGDQRPGVSDSRETDLGPRPFPVPEPRIIEGIAPEAARREEAEHGSLADASEGPQRTDWGPRDVGASQDERAENEPHQPPDPMPDSRIEDVAPEAARYPGAEHDGLADASEGPQPTGWSHREGGAHQVERGENEPHRPDQMPEPRIEDVAPEAARREEAEHDGLVDASEGPQRTGWGPREGGTPEVERGEDDPHQPPDPMPEARIEGGAPEANRATSHQPGESYGDPDAAQPADGQPEEEPGSSETYPATDGSSAGST